MRNKSNNSEAPSIHHSVGYWTSLLARTMEAEFNRRLSDYGLTRSSYAVLGSMHFDCKTTPSELAGFLGLDNAAVTRLLDKLEAQDLIERSRPESDRRSVSLLVKPKGKALAAALLPESRAVNAHFTAGLNPEDVEQYVETVKKMLANGEPGVETL